MKNLKGIIAIIGILLLSFSFQTTVAQNNAGNTPVGELITIKVFFHCANGKATLEKELPKKRGIFSAKANLQTKEVVIDFDPAATDKKHIVEAIEQIGYSTEFSKSKKSSGCSH